MPQSEKYNIILIEPSPVIQQGIKTLLSADPRYAITHTFSDFQSYENTFLKDNIQFILINPHTISVFSHFSAKNQFPKHPDALIVALIYNYISSEVLESFDGSLDIYCSGAQMIKKLLKISESAVDNHKTTTDNVGLSDREKEILISAAIGLTNKEIAEKHNISVHTVISHRKNISRKIGIKSVSGLTIYAIFNNLISENDIQ